MSRHRQTPARTGIVARSRRPALLGGVLGGGTALVIGIVMCALVAASSVGVHFVFSDPAMAAITDSGRNVPAVDRPLAGVGASPSANPAPTQTPTPSSAPSAGDKGAAAPAPVAGGVSATNGSASEASAPGAAGAGNAAAPAPSPSSSPAASPASSASPAQSPTASPAPDPNGQSLSVSGTGGGTQPTCLLGVLCF